jgi:hypothetical protein
MSNIGRTNTLRTNSRRTNTGRTTTFEHQKDELEVEHQKDEDNRKKKDHWGIIGVSSILTLMVIMMVVGIIYIASVLTINNAGKLGNVRLHNNEIIPLVVFFVVFSAIFLYWFYQ